MNSTLAVMLLQESFRWLYLVCHAMPWYIWYIRKLYHDRRLLSWHTYVISWCAYVRELSSIYLNERCEAILVLRRTAAAAGVFEVEVEAVKATLPQVVDGGGDELLTPGRRRQHRRHVCRSEVPSADGEQGFEVWIQRLQIVEPLVPDDMQITIRYYSVYKLRQAYTCTSCTYSYGTAGLHRLRYYTYTIAYL